MVNLKHIFRFLAALSSLGAALLIVIRAGLPQPMDNRYRDDTGYIAAVGWPAPPFALRNQSNELVSLESHTGAVTILNFWSTSCAPCQREMRDLQKLYVDNHDLLRILAINLGDSRQDISAWRDKLELSYDLLHDPALRTARRYGIRGLPTTYLLDERRVVAAVYFGPVSYDQMLGAVRGMRYQPIAFSS